MHFRTIMPAGRAASPVARRSSRVLFLRISWLYLMASFAAAAVTLMLVTVGGEFTIRQWLIWGPMIPVGLAIYTVLDILFIHYQLRPITRALDLLDDYGLPNRDILGDGIVQALNLPLLAFLRVTLFHGPVAVLLLVTAFVLSNVVFDAGFQLWQIGAFCATAFFFA